MINSNEMLQTLSLGKVIFISSSPHRISTAKEMWFQSRNAAVLPVQVSTKEVYKELNRIMRNKMKSVCLDAEISKLSLQKQKQWMGDKGK
jgi:4-diphosphocytidyl-2C-methyl-D-erythritol kinase